MFVSFCFFHRWTPPFFLPAKYVYENEWVCGHYSVPWRAWRNYLATIESACLAEFWLGQSECSIVPWIQHAELKVFYRVFI